MHCYPMFNQVAIVPALKLLCVCVLASVLKMLGRVSKPAFCVPRFPATKAVSIKGHNRDDIIKLLEDSGLDIDAAEHGRIWQSYTKLELKGSLKSKNRPRKGKSKNKSENAELDPELQIHDPAESSSSASTQSPSHEVVTLQAMD